MKGVVFTEFLDFVSGALGSDVADDIIDDADVPNGGAYTAVGTYPYTEMQALVTALSRRTGKPVPDLLTLFGRHLCRRFAVRYPEFFTVQTSLFDFLESVDAYIHREVHKLYPDAELPVFRPFPLRLGCDRSRLRELPAPRSAGRGHDPRRGRPLPPARRHRQAEGRAPGRPLRALLHQARGLTP